MCTYITCPLACILSCAPPFQRVWVQACYHGNFHSVKLQICYGLSLVVTGNQYREAPTSSVSFPTAADLVNYTKGSMDRTTQINVPPSLIQERMTEMDDTSKQ